MFRSFDMLFLEFLYLYVQSKIFDGWIVLTVSFTYSSEKLMIINRYNIPNCIIKQPSEPSNRQRLDSVSIILLKIIILLIKIYKIVNYTER